MSAELLRRLNNLVTIGTITESKSVNGLALARVNILDRVTDFLPVLQMANSFKTHAIPIRPGEQVIVLQLFGNGDSGVILGSIFNKGQKEPAGYSDTREVITYSDGTTISYDEVSKTLDVDAVNAININCKNATVVSDAISITAATSHEGDISIDGKLNVTGNISTDGTVTDMKGDLTNFSTTDGAARA